MNEEPNELDILNEGRRAVAVVFKDGRTGDVTVKKVGLVDMPKLAAATGDYIAEADCYLEKTAVDALSEESVLDVVEIGREINDPLLHRWLKLREKDLERQGVDLKALQAAIIEKIAAQAAAEVSEPSSTESPEPVTEASNKS